MQMAWKNNDHPKIEEISFGEKIYPKFKKKFG